MNGLHQICQITMFLLIIVKGMLGMICTPRTTFGEMGFSETFEIENHNTDSFRYWGFRVLMEDSSSAKLEGCLTFSSTLTFKSSESEGDVFYNINVEESKKYTSEISRNTDLGSLFQIFWKNHVGLAATTPQETDMVLNEIEIRTQCNVSHLLEFIDVSNDCRSEYIRSGDKVNITLEPFESMVVLTDYGLEEALSTSKHIQVTYTPLFVSEDDVEFIYESNLDMEDDYEGPHPFHYKFGTSRYGSTLSVGITDISNPPVENSKYVVGILSNRSGKRNTLTGFRLVVREDVVLTIAFFTIISILGCSCALCICLLYITLISVLVVIISKKPLDENDPCDVFLLRIVTLLKTVSCYILKKCIPMIPFFSVFSCKTCKNLFREYQLHASSNRLEICRNIKKLLSILKEILSVMTNILDVYLVIISHPHCEKMSVCIFSAIIILLNFFISLFMIVIFIKYTGGIFYPYCGQGKREAELHYDGATKVGWFLMSPVVLFRLILAICFLFGIFGTYGDTVMNVVCYPLAGLQFLIMVSMILAPQLLKWLVIIGSTVGLCVKCDLNVLNVLKYTFQEVRQPEDNQNNVDENLNEDVNVESDTVQENMQEEEIVIQ